MKAKLKIKESTWTGLSSEGFDKSAMETDGEVIDADSGLELIGQLKNAGSHKKLGIKSKMTVVEIQKNFVLIKMEDLKDTDFDKTAPPPHYMFQIDKEGGDVKAGRVLKLLLGEERSFVTTQLVTDAGIYYTLKLLEISE